MASSRQELPSENDLAYELIKFIKFAHPERASNILEITKHTKTAIGKERAEAKRIALQRQKVHTICAHLNVVVHSNGLYFTPIFAERKRPPHLNYSNELKRRVRVGNSRLESI